MSELPSGSAGRVAEASTAGATLRAALRATLIGLLLCLICVSATGADDALQRMVLRDGSVIVGHVQALQDGVYTFESRDLGTLRVPQERVARLEHAPTVQERPAPETAAGPPAPAPAPSGEVLSAAEIEELQQRILSDEDLLATLYALRGTPEMQAVLSDPEILSALQRGDLEALAANPRIQKLMDDPAVRHMREKLDP